jgi:hypothetical protein
MRLSRWRVRTNLEQKSDTCRRVGGLETIRKLRKKERFLLSMKIMREIGRQGFAKKFEAAAMKEIFDEKVLELVKAKQTGARVVLDMLKQAVEFGIGTEAELARRAFLILRKNGTYIAKLAHMADLDTDKQRILFALEHDRPLSTLDVNGEGIRLDDREDKEVQKAVRKTIKKKIKAGDYPRAAEIAFTFQREGLVEGIEKACRELGIPCVYERVWLAPLFYSM